MPAKESHSIKMTVDLAPSLLDIQLMSQIIKFVDGKVHELTTK